MAEDKPLVLAYEAYCYYGALAEDPAQPLWTVVRSRIAAGGRIQADYEAALQRRDADMAAYARAMQGHDALLMPACDQAAQPLDAADLRHAGSVLAAPGELSGAAAISLPAGFDGEGMPIGCSCWRRRGGCSVDGCAAAVEGCWGGGQAAGGGGLGVGTRRAGSEVVVVATGNLLPKVVLDSVFSTACTAENRAALARHFSLSAACAAANAWWSAAPSWHSF